MVCDDINSQLVGSSSARGWWESKSPVMKEYTEEQDSWRRPERSQPPTASPSNILTLGEMGTLHSALHVCELLIRLRISGRLRICVHIYYFSSDVTVSYSIWTNKWFQPDNIDILCRVCRQLFMPCEIVPSAGCIKEKQNNAWVDKYCLCVAQ